MKEYIARPNYEYELTELTEPGKLCGPTGVFVKKDDCDTAIAKAREEGRREGLKEAAKMIFTKAEIAGFFGYVVQGVDQEFRLDDFLYEIHTALLGEKEEGE